MTMTMSTMEDDDNNQNEDNKTDDKKNDKMNGESTSNNIESVELSSKVKIEINQNYMQT